MGSAIKYKPRGGRISDENVAAQFVRGGYKVKAVEILPRIFGQGYSQPTFVRLRPAVMQFSGF